MNEPVYGDILHVTPDLWKTIGFLDDYLNNRSKRYWHFSHSSFTFWTEVPATVRLTRYEDGREVGSREWSAPGWLPMRIKFVFIYLVFLRVAWLIVPRGAWVVAHFSLFVAGHSWLGRLRDVRTLYWCWDHFDGGSGIYSLLDDHAVRTCPQVRFISEPMARLYERRLPGRTPGQTRGILPLGVKCDTVVREPQDGLLGYIGNTRSDDGLDDVIQSMVSDPSLELEIVGHGNWDEQLAAAAKRLGVSSRVRLLGRIFDDVKLARIVNRWQIGLAPYRKSAYSPYGDSGKVKKYWQFGLPVVMTATMDIHREISAERAGEVAGSESGELLEAIGRIRREPASYERGVRVLRERYEYQRLYDNGLVFMRTKI